MLFFLTHNDQLFMFMMVKDILNNNRYLVTPYT